MSNNKENRNLFYKIQIKPEIQESSIEISIENLEEIKNNIDNILLDLDKLYIINKIILNRLKFASLFTVTAEKVLFLSKFEKWTIWEKIALILFTKYPFSFSKTFLCNHDDIDSKHLTTYIERHEDFFIVDENDDIGLSDKGYVIIKEKLEEELAKKNKDINEKKSD